MIYRAPNRIDEGIRNSISVLFVPGQWKSVDGRPVSREEIMMTLANVENALIRLQYIDAVQREVELLNIVMDSADTSDRGLGSASLVEECTCPAGYSGIFTKESQKNNNNNFSFLTKNSVKIDIHLIFCRFEL